MTKRFFDIVAASIGLVVLSPLLVVCAVYVKLDSKGPVFFRQIRVGLRGSTFRIHKFRTMVDNAEADGEQITAARDIRITECGAILRRYKLDELPQLIDVLLGHMSLVGPRPEVPRFIAHVPEPVRSVILSVRPGITDMASVHFRDESALLSGANNADYYIGVILPQKLRYYVDYVNQQSFWLDMKIILLTFGVLLQRTQPVATVGK